MNSLLDLSWLEVALPRDLRFVDASVWLTVSMAHFLWQGMLWAAACEIVCALWRRASASTRYTIHVCTLFAMITTFAVTLWLGFPSTRTETTKETQFAQTSIVIDPATFQTTKPQLREKSFEPSWPDVKGTNTGSRQTAVSTLRNTTELTTPADNAIQIGDSGHSTLLLVQYIAPLLTILYLGGVVIMVARLIMGIYGCHVLLRDAYANTDQSLSLELQRQMDRLRIRVKPLILWCHQLAVPKVVGVLRPTILLPVCLGSGMTTDQVLAILAHELAHIRRGDLLLNLIQRCIEAILFFHPAVWHVSHRIRIEREKCCDDWVIDAGWPRLAYADALVTMAELSARSGATTVNLATVAATGTSPSEFKLRILRLLSIPSDTGIAISPNSALGISLLAVIGITTGLLASQVPQEHSQSTHQSKGTSDTRSRTSSKGDNQRAPADVQKLTVTVVDSRGIAVPNQQVFCLHENTDQIETFSTDNAGQVQVPAAWSESQSEEASDVTLFAGDSKGRLAWYSFRQHARLLKQSSSDARKVAVAPSKEIQMELNPLDRIVRGRLTNKDQVGLPKIQVALASWGNQGAAGASLRDLPDSSLPIPVTWTDADGRFELKVPSGFHIVARTWDRNYCQTSMNWTPQADEPVIKVLEQGGRIRGVVRNVDDGQTVAGSSVYVRGVSLDGKYGSFARVVADAHGEFESPALLPDQYTVTVRSPHSVAGLVPAKQIRTKVVAGQTTSTDVLLTQGIKVGGRCVEAKSGRGISNQLVRIEVKMGLNDQSLVDFATSRKTNANGDFQFEAPAGICRIFTDGPRRTNHSDSMRVIQTIAGQQVNPVILKLGNLLEAPKPERVNGTVTEEKVATSGAKLTASPARPRLEVELITDAKDPLGEHVVRTIFRNSNFVNEWSLKTGAKFEKEFMPQEIGKIARLLIDVPGFRPIWTTEFQVAATMPPLRVPLQSQEFVEIRGRIIDHKRQPLSGARIRVRRIYYGRDNQFPWGPEVSTDSEGRFTINHIRRGEDVVLVADHVDHVEFGQALSALIQVLEAKPLVVPDLFLSLPDQIVAGVVRDQDGLPVAGVKVSFEHHPARDTQSDEQGQFQLTGLPHGQIELCFRAGDGSETRHAVMSGTRDARFFLPLKGLYNRPENILTLQLSFPDTSKSVHWRYYLIDDDTKTVTQWAKREALARVSEKIDLGSRLRNRKTLRLSMVILADGCLALGPVAIKLQPEIEPLKLDLKPATSPRVSIRIIDDKGRPVAGAKLGKALHFTPDITFTDYRYVGNMPEEAPSTDADGQIEFRDNPVGLTLSFYANATGFAGAWSERVTLSRDTSFTLTLVPATRNLKGIVVDQDGTSIRDAQVILHDFADLRTNTGKDGSFQLTGVPNGELILYSRAYGYDDRVLRVSELDARQPITIRLPREAGVILPETNAIP